MLLDPSHSVRYTQFHSIIINDPIVSLFHFFLVISRSYAFLILQQKNGISRTVEDLDLIYY